MHFWHPLSALAVLLQGASVSALDGLGTHLVQFAVAIIVAMNAWMVRTVQETREMVRRINQALFGVNNDNGINSKVNALDALVTEHEAYIQHTVPERLRLWEDFKRETNRRLALFDDRRRNGPGRREDDERRDAEDGR